MYWWTILEISEDSDLKTIKKAYAKLLKEHNPEDDAAGYQRIRTAYDEAVKYAKKNNKVKSNQELINNSTENVIEELDLKETIENESENYLKSENKINKSKIDPYIDKINNEKIEQEDKINEEKIKTSKVNLYFDSLNQEKSKLNNKIKEEKINKSKVDQYLDKINNEKNDNNEQIKNNDLKQQIKAFFNRLNEVYNNMNLRIYSSVWDELLNLDIMWDANAFHIIEDEMFEFLTTHKYLPAEIWRKLNKNFTWSKNEIKLYKKYSAPLVEEVLKNLKEPNKLKYDYLMDMDSEIADKYLYEREQAYEALEYGDYHKVYEHLKNASSLFKKDPELLRLMGNYLYEAKDMDKALEKYKSAFEINNYDLESALRCGIILVLAKRFNEAIPYLEVYLSQKDKNMLAIDYIAFCYYYTDNLPLAVENFKKLLSLNKNNIVAQKYINNIEEQLEGKRVRKIKFNEESLIKEKVVQKKINKENEKNEESINNEVGCLRFFWNIFEIVIGLMFLVAVCIVGFKNVSASHKFTKSYEDNGEYQLINSPLEFTESENNTKIKIYFSSVKPIRYYKVSVTLKDSNILSEEELDKNGLQDKVISQLYIGSFQQHLYIFTDPNCNDKTINKNSGYQVKGTKCELDKKMQSNIQLEYASDYSNAYTWSVGLIDASKVNSNKEKAKSNSKENNNSNNEKVEK
ncbi:J domain-containing protein [Clostridium saccharoperbutylacetonicum]